MNKVCPYCGYNRNNAWVGACHRCGRTFRRGSLLSEIVAWTLLAAVIAAAGFGGWRFYKNGSALKTAQEMRCWFGIGTTRAGAYCAAAREKAIALVPEKHRAKIAFLERRQSAVPALRQDIKPAPSEMAYIPAGAFMMGEAGTEGLPRREVRLDAYYLDKHELSVEEYRRCAAAGACAAPVIGADCNYARPDSADFPVNCVSWHDAAGYCRWAGKRLPTEAEFEKAARAGSKGKFSFGNNEEQLFQYGWFDRNSDDMTHPAASRSPNAWGIFDMHGNVWEWTQDWYVYSYRGLPSQNPAGAASGKYKVLRGGSAIDIAETCRSANRFRLEPDRSNTMTGFRCAQSAPPDAKS